MKQFDVIVGKKKVVVMLKGASLKSYDVSANVDGEIHLYRIIKELFAKLPYGWRDRGYVQAHYHAKNAGNQVNFNWVKVPGKKRKMRNNMAQLGLFD